MSSKAKYILDIPGKPFGKQRPKFGRGRAYTPQETADYEEYVRLLFQKEYGRPMLTGGIGIEIKAYFEVPKSVSMKRRAKMLSNEIRPTKKPDCDNIVKIILDSLNGTAYADDRQITALAIEKLYSAEPSVRLTLWEENSNENIFTGIIEGRSGK